MNDHSICRNCLAYIRKKAKEKRVKVPLRMAAIRATHNTFFVQGVNDPGEYVKGDCAWDAKVQRIARLLNQEEESRLTD